MSFPDISANLGTTYSTPEINVTAYREFQLAPALNALVANFLFYPLEVVSRYRDPQLEVGENSTFLLNLCPNIWYFY